MAIIANNDTFEKIRSTIGIDGDELDLQPPHPSLSSVRRWGFRYPTIHCKRTLMPIRYETHTLHSHINAK